ncbi:MAG: class I SAM-dependent methyltransferase [Oscillospiraceae bacterium]|jgi:SAM-dependent methyltransferase|nr:class I SAM-dependent methyltransferase [Oscillospiraceae bacterium]
MSNTTRFTGKAAAYDRSRPAYPDDALACVLRACNLHAGDAVADIGAGTGKFTRQLLAQDLHVFAVEPNADMRTAACDNLGNDTLFHAVGAPAEATTLPDHSVKAITAAQAFHWFDHEQCKAEFARILVPDGKVALLWNTRDHASPLNRAHEALMEKYRVRYAVHKHDFAHIYDTFFAHWQEYPFHWAQPLDEEGFVALTLSRSYAPSPEDAGYRPLMDGIHKLFAQYQQDGTVSIEYITRVVIGNMQ